MSRCDFEFSQAGDMEQAAAGTLLKLLESAQHVPAGQKMENYIRVFEKDDQASVIFHKGNRSTLASSCAEAACQCLIYYYVASGGDNQAGLVGVLCDSGETWVGFNWNSRGLKVRPARADFLEKFRKSVTPHFFCPSLKDWQTWRSQPSVSSGASPK